MRFNSKIAAVFAILFFSLLVSLILPIKFTEKEYPTGTDFKLLWYDDGVAHFRVVGDENGFFCERNEFGKCGTVEYFDGVYVISPLFSADLYYRKTNTVFVVRGDWRFVKGSSYDDIYALYGISNVEYWNVYGDVDRNNLIPFKNYLTMYDLRWFDYVKYYIFGLGTGSDYFYDERQNFFD